MSGRCDSCRWWTPRDEHDTAARIHDVFPRDPVTYEELPGPHEIRFCLSPKLLDNTETYGEGRNIDRDGAMVVDGSGYVAELLTAPDFGCVNQEPR